MPRKQTKRQATAHQTHKEPKHKQYGYFVLNPKKTFPGRKVDRVKVRQLKDPPSWSYLYKTWMYFETFREDEIVPYEEAEKGKADVAEENARKRARDADGAKALNDAKLVQKKAKKNLVITLRKEIEEQNKQIKEHKKEVTALTTTVKRLQTQLAKKAETIKQLQASLVKAQVPSSSSESESSSESSAYCSSDEEEVVATQKADNKQTRRIFTLNLRVTDFKKRVNSLEREKTTAFRALKTADANLKKSQEKVALMEGVKATLKEKEAELKSAKKKIETLQSNVQKLKDANSENYLKIQLSKEKETKLKEDGLLNRKKVEALAKVEQAKLQYKGKKVQEANSTRNQNRRNVSNRFYGQSQIMGHQQSYNRGNNLSQMFGNQNGYTPGNQNVYTPPTPLTPTMPQVPASGVWSPQLQQDAITMSEQINNIGVATTTAQIE